MHSIMSDNENRDNRENQRAYREKPEGSVHEPLLMGGAGPPDGHLRTRYPG